jgi:hypothetical protein
VRCKIFMVTVKVIALWDMILCRVADTEQFFRGICCLHH